MPDELQPAGTSPESEVAEGATEAPAPAKKTAAKRATAKKAAAKKTAAKKTAAKKATSASSGEAGSEAATRSTRKATAKKGSAKKAAATAEEPEAVADPALIDLPDEPPAAAPEAAEDAAGPAPAKKTAKKAAKKAAPKKTAKTTTRKRSAGKPAAAGEEPADEGAALTAEAPAQASGAGEGATSEDSAAPAAPSVLFQAPEPKKSPARRTRKTAKKPPEATEKAPADATPAEEAAEQASGEKTETETQAAESAASGDTSQKAGEQTGEQDETGEGGGSRRRRRRGGRRRRKSGDGESTSPDTEDQADEAEADPKPVKGGEQSATEQGESGGEGSSRRRRRRRRSGDDSGDGGDDPQNTVTKVRRQRSAEDEITALSGSTRLEAKKQRRREGREAGRRRAPIVSEAEFLARREAVDRVMVIRQREDLTQIAVLEDKVLVEHYVARESQTSLIGNVYLGRVQNVLPSMEAAFIDIGKGRNAVLYAGEVNWSALGHREGQPRKIESVLTSGQSVLVQVTKDPIGHKGARLTSQVSLAGRFLVYVPDGTTSGISRKLPDTERNRLKALLKEIVPDSAGVIVRTAAEGASEDELTRDVERLKARWEDIEKNAKSGSGPKLLYGEPDLTLKVVRDLFTEDFSKLVIQGDDAWDTVQGYVGHVAPDLEDRLERYEPAGGGKDVFAAHRIDEQIAKGLDRKVWLPSGGSLIIDRTEAMTVVDVNTGKFTGSGGNLEETVTKNNLEAAEEIVRQLRLRDIGGIIVVDFIDMVLESNRELVLRRLVECLGRDRTRHQVAEVTSLGLVQMTRKRIGTGLLEAFSETCEHCHGRGLLVKEAPVEPKGSDDESRRGRRSRGGRGRGQEAENGQAKPDSQQHEHRPPSPKDVAAMAKEHAERPADGKPAQPEAAEVEAAQEPTEDSVQEPTQEPAQEPAQQRAAEPAEPESPAEPERPKVVTRTRTRRAASRPAGQPTHTSTPEVVVVEATAPEPDVPAADVAAAAPKVVTRTRGRRASRPAGPPADAATATATTASMPTLTGSAGTVGAPLADGQVEPGTANAEPGSAPGGSHEDAHEDAHPVEHVPIKKKGSRKR